MKTLKQLWLPAFTITSVLTFPINGFASGLSLYQLQSDIKFKDAKKKDLRTLNDFKNYIKSLEDESIYLLLKEKHASTGKLKRGNAEVAKVWSGIGACHIIDAKDSSPSIMYDEYFVSLHNNALSRLRVSSASAPDPYTFNKYMPEPISYYQYGFGCRNEDQTTCPYERYDLKVPKTSAVKAKAAALLREAIDDPTDPCGLVEFFNDPNSPAKRDGATSLASQAQDLTDEDKLGTLISVKSHDRMIATHDFKRCGYIPDQTVVEQIISQFIPGLNSLEGINLNPSTKYPIAEMSKIFCKHIGYSENRGKNLPIGHENRISATSILRVDADEFQAGVQFKADLLSAIDALKSEVSMVAIAGQLLAEEYQLLQYHIYLDQAGSSSQRVAQEGRREQSSEQATSETQESGATTYYAEGIVTYFAQVSLIDKVDLAYGRNISTNSQLKDLEQQLIFMTSGGAKGRAISSIGHGQTQPSLINQLDQGGHMSSPSSPLGFPQ